VAVALIGRPKVVYLDEPSTGQICDVDSKSLHDPTSGKGCHIRESIHRDSMIVTLTFRLGELTLPCQPHVLLCKHTYVT